jgi:hypothetical protein
VKTKLTPGRLVAFIFLLVTVWIVVSRLIKFGEVPTGITVLLLAYWGVVTVAHNAGWETRGSKKPWRLAIVLQAIALIAILVGTLLIRFPFDGGTTEVIIGEDSGFTVESTTSFVYINWIRMGWFIVYAGVAALSIFVITDLATRGKDEPKSGEGRGPLI